MSRLRAAGVPRRESQRGGERRPAELTLSKPSPRANMAPACHKPRVAENFTEAPEGEDACL